MNLFDVNVSLLLFELFSYKGKFWLNKPFNCSR